MHYILYNESQEVRDVRAYVHVHVYTSAFAGLPFTVHKYIVELHWKPCNGNVYIYLAVTVVPL